MVECTHMMATRAGSNWRHPASRLINLKKKTSTTSYSNRLRALILVNSTTIWLLDMLLSFYFLDEEIAPSGDFNRQWQRMFF